MANCNFSECTKKMNQMWITNEYKKDSSWNPKWLISKIRCEYVMNIMWITFKNKISIHVFKFYWKKLFYFITNYIKYINV